MTEIEIELSPRENSSKAVSVVEECCRLEGLTRKSKGTLSKFPGCIHWHYRKPGFNGTLEITYWKKEPRLWYKVHPRRRGAWMIAVLPRLKAGIEEGLASPAV